jgi:hypothetical protein
MFDRLPGYLLRLAANMWTNIDWLIQQMDMTQWAIVAALFVVLGGISLRNTR